MYMYDGYDGNGLNLCVRTNGTKGEIFIQQKLKVGAGPFGIGVETAHYYHGILSYMYLVNT